VAPGPSDLIARGPVRRLDLYATEVGDEDGYRYAFTRDAARVPAPGADTPGPMLVFEVHEAAEVTVHNRLRVHTSVHWHGLELDAWSDGVPHFSASDGRMSPAIAPGDSFTYRLSFLRPGTFIYHSHLDDVHQLAGGLYGALIVLPPGERFEPRTDHIAIVGWSTPEPETNTDFELNGHVEQPPGRARVGERHRFRLINIAPAGQISAWIMRDGESVPVVLHAKDGADLPPYQRVPVTRFTRLGAGETLDFVWTPAEPGTYELRVGPQPDRAFVQVWTVDPAP
jgi:FtsP/CotA-like multicopper oxidase with cupredoxin domain